MDPCSAMHVSRVRYPLLRFFILTAAVVVITSGVERTDDGEEATLYYVGLTSALIYYGKGGEISRCRLFLETDEDKARHPDDIGYEGHEDDKRIKISFTEMLDVIRQCKEFGDPDENGTLPNWLPWTLVRGILPGTKWCGVNDLARNYEDLGVKKELDKCCREHDHCPVRIHGFQKRFGVYNPSLYTRTHCDCDDEFFDCLKSQNSKEADMVGMFYFNGVSTQCVTEDHPKKCVNQGITSCTKWEADLNQPKTYIMTDGRKQWQH